MNSSSTWIFSRNSSSTIFFFFFLILVRYNSIVQKSSFILKLDFLKIEFQNMGISLNCFKQRGILLESFGENDKWPFWPWILRSYVSITLLVFGFCPLCICCLNFLCFCIFLTAFSKNKKMHSMILFQLTCKIVMFLFVGVMLCDQLPYNDYFSFFL